MVPFDGTGTVGVGYASENYVVSTMIDPDLSVWGTNAGHH
jgi:hypothetical protein